MFFVFPPRPLTRLELAPTASWWPAESPRPCLMPSPACLCWRRSPWVHASPHPLCALYWAGKSQAIMGLRSHPTTSTWGMSVSPWGTWRAMSSRVCCPRPCTGECDAGHGDHTAQLHIGNAPGVESGLKCKPATQTFSLGSTGICSHSLMEWIVVVCVQMLFSPAFFPLLLAFPLADPLFWVALLR